MKLKVKKLNPKAKIPSYQTNGSAGADLCALLESPVTIEPNQTVLIPTGLSFAIPEGYGGFIFARSGLASKKGLAPANKVGVIDSDYRGELMVALHNHGKEAQTILPEDRIAQFVIMPILQADFLLVDTLEETERGAGGFGSTGM